MKQVKWQEELKLQMKFKTTFILEGEILDKQPYFEKNTMLLLPISNYLEMFLRNKGYRTIVFFDHVRGFYDGGNNSITRFNKIYKKAKKLSEETEISLNHDGNRESKFLELTDMVRFVMRNQDEPVAIIINHASRFIASINSLSESDLYLFSELFLATQEFNNPESVDGNGRLNNLMFLNVDKINDLPTWLYLNNPFVKTLFLPRPSKYIREEYLSMYIEELYGYDSFLKLPEDEKVKARRKFVDLTEGLLSVDLDTIRGLMKEEKISLLKIDKAISLFKYGLKENPWNDDDMIHRLDDLLPSLKHDVKGQEHCIQQATDIITRAVYGLSGIQHSSSSSKPKGIMFFSGPTGVGKTELAKGLARWLFGTEEACIRFDMSEYAQSHADQKLLGAPPGYVGYESGGQLTNAIKENPFSILLFDEIEKADPSILDKFLQILEDGRMTDGKGETVYFSDAIIIFTSNLGVSKEKIDMYGNKTIENIIQYKDDNSNYEIYRNKVLGGIEHYFLNQLRRPELKNRIGDNFVIFEYITEEVGDMIAESILKKIIKNLLDEKNIVLSITDNAKNELFTQLHHYLPEGGRGIGSGIEKHFINPLARYLGEHKILRAHTIIIEGFKKEDQLWSLVCQ
jgi:hypothetical protein